MQRQSFLKNQIFKITQGKSLKCMFYFSQIVAYYTIVLYLVFLVSKTS